MLKPALFLALLLPLLAGCSTRSGGGGGGDDDDDDGTWNVRIDNQSSNTMDQLRQRPCPSEDEGDWNEIALGPDGLAPGESMTTWLPKPGCFDLSASGEGCFAEGTTDPMEQGDTVTWTISDGDLSCAG